MPRSKFAIRGLNFALSDLVLRCANDLVLVLFYRYSTAVLDFSSNLTHHISRSSSLVAKPFNQGQLQAREASKHVFEA